MKAVLVFLALSCSFVLTLSCETDQLECNNGNCIPIRWICDGEDDCGDGSDEPPQGNPELCPACDEETEFRCNNGQCVFNYYICDGEAQCLDGSDEFSNPSQCPACRDNQYRCPNGHCIPQAFVCDGYDDCGDSSDERNCPATTTSSSLTNQKY